MCAVIEDADCCLLLSFDYVYELDYYFAFETVTETEIGTAAAAETELLGADVISVAERRIP